MKSRLEQPKHRILVVDDHSLVREGLNQLIKQQSDLVCCGLAGGILAARQAVATLKPDLVVLDLRLPDGDGLDLIRELAAQYPSVHILVVTQCDENLYAERALKAGARGYVMKESATEEVLTAIRAVLAGEFHVSKKVAALALLEMAGKKPKTEKNGIGNLTNRELQVFQLLGTGMSTRKIAAQLNISVKTVETHRENIKQKMDLPNAPELAHFATVWMEGKDPRTSPCQVIS